MLRQKKLDRSSKQQQQSESSGRKQRRNKDDNPRYRAVSGSGAGGGDSGDSDDDGGGDVGRRRSKAKRESEKMQRQLCSSNRSSGVTGGGGGQNRHHHHHHHQGGGSLMLPHTSDDDIDPELREGINNIMKLRDEYDKLEGALRKLGVDPESVVAAGDEEEEEEDEVDEEEDDQEDDGDDEEDMMASSSAASATNRDLLSELDPLLQSRISAAASSSPPQPDPLRRHLGILEEVDESLLSASSDVGGGGGDDVRQHRSSSSSSSYPWVQMALPGGGVVSVPLSSSGAKADLASLLGDAVVSPSTAAAAANAGDMLTVRAGEPVTHFNLDQLLEIVQSFQLDTTLAGHEEGAPPYHMALADGHLIMQSSQNESDGCDGNQCDSSGLKQQVNGSRTEDEATAAAAANEMQLREIHSCPSSPTETDCSSGFSTLRRRSVTLTEKIRTNRDGSKTQVVRQYGCNTSSNNQPSDQSVTFQQNSFVYINGNGMECSGVGGSASQSFPSLLPITANCQISGSGGSSGGGTMTYSTTLPRCSTSGSGGSGATPAVTSSSNTGSLRHPNSYRGHIVRLNSIEPNTVMFSTKDYPILGDISVPEIIDELEKQFEDKLSDLQGVRLVANNVYICLSRKESLQHLTTYGFYVRGVPIKVVDITNDSVVICLTGVPHYITDATITMLVSTFGISIGEVERRFYKGVDTGERFVRLKPRAHTQVPDFVTVGGCKILIRVLSQEEVCLPFTLQSVHTDKEDASSAAASASASQPKSRSKPGHCNGKLNSPGSSSKDHSIIPVSSPTTTLASSSSMMASSPKIGKSLRSRLSGAISRSSPPAAAEEVLPTTTVLDEIDGSTNSYVPAEALDIPTLSPPPYKAPGSSNSAGSVSSVNNLAAASSSSNPRNGRSNPTAPENGLDLKLNGSGGSSSKGGVGLLTSSLRKYRPSKTDSSNSLTSSLAGKSTEAVRDGCNNNNGKRSSVVFDEEQQQQKGKHRSGVLNSKTVNGILRKGSGPGDDIVAMEEKSRKTSRKSNKEYSRSSGKSGSKGGKGKPDEHENEKEKEAAESRSSRSRSNSTKSGSKEKQKDLALTRDLPWCGCWGNGCL